MKNLEAAISKAKALCRKKSRDYYVVYSPGEYDEPGNDYHIANEFDLDSWFAGCDILYATGDIN